MKKILMAIMVCMVLTPSIEAGEHSRTIQTKIDFAQKIFRKKLQRKCGYTAGYWAQQHTLIEWKMIQKSGNFKDELLHMCPKVEKILKDKWMEPLYLFAKEYAQDTGNRPRC